MGVGSTHHSYGFLVCKNRPYVAHSYFLLNFLKLHSFVDKESYLCNKKRLTSIWL